MVIVRMPVLSGPFLINIAFTLEFYSPSFSIRCFLVPETYCIRGKYSRKYGIYIHTYMNCSSQLLLMIIFFLNIQ